MTFDEFSPGGVNDVLLWKLLCTVTRTEGAGTAALGTTEVRRLAFTDLSLPLSNN